MSLGQNYDEDGSPAIQGAFPILRVSGITVFIHWSWLLVAAYQIQYRSKQYDSFLFNVIEYLILFGLVLLHEFGHSLACRSVGGAADRILLWPLGGVAFVKPPERPGPILWSIVAGPLVNAFMVPVLIVSGTLLRDSGAGLTNPDLLRLLETVFNINLGLLCFNLIPVYPLDGGQILRSLLWFPLGRAKSLLVTAIIGFVGVGLLILMVLGPILAGSSSGMAGAGWLIVVLIFIIMSCWRGLVSALAMAKIDRMPHREEFACPDCGEPPLVGTNWQCNRCQTSFDTFQTNATCPNCGTLFLSTRCPECGVSHPMSKWKKAPVRREF